MTLDQFIEDLASKRISSPSAFSVRKFKKQLKKFIKKENEEVEIGKKLPESAWDREFEEIDQKVVDLIVEKGNLRLLKKLLHFHLHFPYKFWFNTNELMVKAVKGNHLKIVKYLVEKQAERVLCNSLALYNAAEKGHLEIVRYLIGKGKTYYYQALESAIINGHLEVLKVMMAGERELNLMKDRHNKRDYGAPTLSDVAAHFGQLEILQYSVVDKRRETLTGSELYFAARENRMDCVKFMFNRDVLRNTLCYFDEYKEVALKTAADFGNLEIVKFLYENNPFLKNLEECRGHRLNSSRGWCELILSGAVKKGRIEVVQYLVEQKFKVGYKEAELDKIKRDYPEIVMFLKESGAVYLKK